MSDADIPPPSQCAITSVPGRYGYPDLHLAHSFNYEVAVNVGDDSEAVFYNALDFLEGALCAAWGINPEGVTEVLGRSRMNGFYDPHYGPVNHQ
jgi:hypothetical protein